MSQVITPNDLQRWFALHPLREGQHERFEALRTSAYHLARQIYELAPPGYEQAAALFMLRQVVWIASSGISCEGPTQSAYFARKVVRRRVGTVGVDDEGYTKEPEEEQVDDESEDDDGDGDGK